MDLYFENRGKDKVVEEPTFHPTINKKSKSMFSKTGSSFAMRNAASRENLTSLVDSIKKQKEEKEMKGEILKRMHFQTSTKQKECAN